MVLFNMLYVLLYSKWLFDLIVLFGLYCHEDDQLWDWLFCATLMELWDV